eukprot:Skav212449  [mRNA]  locus=scaffold1094:316880:323381:+ [translate_table: standard]
MKNKAKKAKKDSKKVKKEKKIKDKVTKTEKPVKAEKAAKKKSQEEAKAKKRSPPAPAVHEESKKAKKGQKDGKESKNGKAERKPSRGETRKNDDKETEKKPQLALEIKKVEKEKATGEEPVRPPRRVSIKSKPVVITPESSPCSNAARNGTPTLKKQLFVSDESTSSGIASPAISLSSLKAWKDEAANRGLSLEDYMEEVSRNELEQNLESHMLQLVKEGEEKGTEALANESSSEEGESEEDEEEEGKENEDAKEDTKEDDDDENEEEGEGGSDDSSDSGESQEESDEEESEVDEEQLEQELDQLVLSKASDDQKEKAADGNTEAEVKEKKDEAEEKTKSNEEKIAQAVQAHTASKPDFSQANSATHKPQWDKFARQCLDRKKFPTSLATHYIKDKVDLFRRWLEQEGDWSKLAQAKMDECLKKGAEGRKLSIQLQQLEYSGDLPQQMLKFSSKMETVYGLVQDLVKRKVESESKYERHFALIDEKLSWFEKAEAIMSDEDYKRLANPLSPYAAIGGWNLLLAFHDPMHMIFLGVCKDLYASSLAFWIRQGFFGHGSASEKLRQFSHDLRTECRAAKFFDWKLHIVLRFIFAI